MQILAFKILDDLPDHFHVNYSISFYHVKWTSNVELVLLALKRISKNEGFSVSVKKLSGGHLINHCVLTSPLTIASIGLKCVFDIEWISNRSTSLNLICVDKSIQASIPSLHSTHACTLLRIKYATAEQQLLNVLIIFLWTIHCRMLFFVSALGP